MPREYIRIDLQDIVGGVDAAGGGVLDAEAAAGVLKKVVVSFRGESFVKTSRFADVVLDELCTAHRRWYPMQYGEKL